MKPVLLSFGKLHVYAYGMMIAIGIIAAIYYMEKRAPKYGMDSDSAFSMALCAAISGIVGAKVLYLITVLPQLLADPSAITMYLSSGFVVFGGIIGGILSCMLYARHKKWDFIKYFDLFMPSIAMAQGFGRIGCFMAGCCYGRQTDSCFSVTFPTDPFSQAPAGIALIPTQLISSCLNFINCILLSIYARHSKKDGRVGALYLILYSIGRFIIEFYRGDDRGAIGFLSTSQFIALLGFAVGIIIFVVPLGHSRQEDRGAI